MRVDDKVFVRKEMSKPLVPGTIIGKCERPRSFRIKLENDNVIERNKQHIYPFRGSDASFNNNPAEQNLYYDDLGSYDVNDKESVQNNQNVEHSNNVGSKAENAENIVSNQRVNTRSGRVINTPKYLSDYDCT